MAQEQGNERFTYSDALAFVNQEWSRVWATKSSLEQRAITLITTSGVLVTLAFGFTAAVAKGTSFSNFDPAERAFLVVSLALFALSALVALTVNMPKGYSVPDFRDVLGIGGAVVEGKPLDRLDAALKAARDENDKKALRLTLAFCSQLAAIAALAVVVGIVTS
jgi:hypothetical protein